jgi:pimeloyl-ACP methyl ester carboxylesterase
VASHALSDPNPKITRILISIHSSGFDAIQYYENARSAASAVPGALPETLIIAPQFFEQTAIPVTVPEWLLFWSVSPFRGSARGAVGPDARRVRLSAFDVLDDWLGSLTVPGRFPHLRDIVIVGHSAGGQLVQRYAVVGRFEPPPGVRCRYVVSAPSSYAYVSAERFDRTSNQFRVPDGDVAAACPEYNRWGYGLDSPYAYFSDVGAETIARRYAERTVLYLCGERDTDPDDPSLGKTCAAMMQGQHRLDRMCTFAAYLRHKYGESIASRHVFAVVPGAGHSGRRTMTSEAGLRFLFSPVLADVVGSGTFRPDHATGAF